MKPGSARPSVGGRHGDAVVVAVSERAVDGKATEAALRAVAGAFGVRRRDVTLVTGAASRDKIVDIDGAADLLAARLAALLAPASSRESSAGSSAGSSTGKGPGNQSP